MIHRIRAHTGLGIVIASLLHAAVGAEVNRDLPTSADKLVSLLVGENLYRSSQSHRTSDSTAWHASEALIAMGDRAVDALKSGLNSQDEVQRANIVYVLNWINSPSTISVRIRAYQDKSSIVRAMAVSSLPVCSDVPSRELAIRALSDPDIQVRIAAIKSFDPRLDEETVHPNGSPCYAAAGVIVQNLDDRETRATAANVLGRLGNSVAGRPLLKAMHDERALVRGEVMRALGALQDRQFVVEMLPYLDDSDPYVQSATATALGQTEDMRATPNLVAQLDNEKPHVRWAVADALGKIGDLRAVPALVEALKNTDDVGKAVALALGKIGDPRAVDALIPVLDRNDKSASAAATALGQIGDPKAAAPLGNYLRTHLDSREAATALASIRHPAAVVELAEIGSQENSMAVRFAMRKIISGPGGGVAGSPDEIAEWWKKNRKFYEQPVLNRGEERRH